MRAILIVCIVAVAQAQYDYTPSSNAGDGNGGLISNSASGLTQNDAEQLSDPLVVQNEFNKEFYSYTAPEQEFDNSAANEQAGNSLKRNLRVLFIKSPENSGLEQAALQLASSVVDDRTAIYVLSKQADIGELANKFNQVKSASHRPEVHFVKYRTQSDAENAQRTIQAQYDALPGPSSNQNGGTSASVLDFASKGTSSGSADYSAPSNSAYLPPSRGF